MARVKRVPKEGDSQIQCYILKNSVLHIQRDLNMLNKSLMEIIWDEKVNLFHYAQDDPKSPSLILENLKIGANLSPP